MGWWPGKEQAIPYSRLSCLFNAHIKRALNIGLGLAYVFRILLIVGAAWAMQFWQFELAGALYLLWLAWRHFTTELPDSGQAVKARSLWQIIPLMVLTDLAFSLDSVTTAN